MKSKINVENITELTNNEIQNISGGEAGDLLYYIGWGIGAVAGAIHSVMTACGDQGHVPGNYRL